MKTNEYKCANCNNVYEKEWSDEEAMAEAEKNFGKPVEKWKDKQAIVCDDCYELMRPDKFPDLVEEVKKFN